MHRVKNHPVLLLQHATLYNMFVINMKKDIVLISLILHCIFSHI